MLTVLVRLGLRSGEVAALCLDDIDWRAGEVVVRGKGPKQARLPLPADVGEALAAWLRRGRPRCADREVFTRVHAPHRRLSPSGVFAIVAAAGERAGVPGSGPHRLRHTAATQMLAGGASLPEVGQVLRHSPAAHHCHLRKSGPQPARYLGQTLAHGHRAGGDQVRALVAALDDYLALRRSLGFKLARAAKLLAQFVAYCDTHGAEFVTTELALAWACSPVSGRCQLGGGPAIGRAGLCPLLGFRRPPHRGPAR